MPKYAAHDQPIASSVSVAIVVVLLLTTARGEDLANVSAAGLASRTASSTAGTQRPAAGEVNSRFTALDMALVAFADRVGASAVTVAVNIDGDLVYSRGFGWSDAARTTPVRADAMMRVASVSKQFTAAMVMDLIRDQKLLPDTTVFPYLGLRPLDGISSDPRLSEVTVRHLLEHKGGWDSAQALDPMFRMRDVSTALALKGQPTPTDVIRYMLGQPLQFTPGERTAYSNFGYCVLGRVIEKAAGRPYAEALQAAIAKPLDIRDVGVGFGSSRRRDPREVEYPVTDDAFSLDVMDAHGGIIASAPALCRFMRAYWIGGERRKARDKGPEGEFFGSLPGTTAMVLQRSDGIDVAVVLNGRRNGSVGADSAALSKAVQDALD